MEVWLHNEMLCDAWRTKLVETILVSRNIEQSSFGGTVVRVTAFQRCRDEASQRGGTFPGGISLK